MGMGHGVWVAMAAVVAVGGLWIARRWYSARSPLGACVTVGITTLLMSPISWQHHAVWILPCLIVIYRNTRSKPVLITLGVITVVTLLRLPKWGAQWGAQLDSGWTPVLIASVLVNAVTLVLITLLVLLYITRPSRQLGSIS